MVQLLSNLERSLHLVVQVANLSLATILCTTPDYITPAGACWVTVTDWWKEDRE